MASKNKVELAGNLTNDPELRITNGGTPVAQFGLAVSKSYAGKDASSAADYFTVVCWKGLAEAITNNKKKGDAVVVEGRIDYSAYEKEGKTISRTRVVAHDVQFVDSVGGGLNRVTLLGNLTRDPETKHVTVRDEEGVPVCSFGLAMNRVRSGRSHDAADFVEVDAWRELGEIVQDHKKKGHGVLVTGRLASDRWEDRDSGEPRSKVKVVADAVQYTTTAQGRSRAAANASAQGTSNDGSGRSHRSSGNAGGKAGGREGQKKQYQSRYSR